MIENGINPEALAVRYQPWHACLSGSVVETNSPKGAIKELRKEAQEVQIDAARRSA